MSLPSRQQLSRLSRDRTFLFRASMGLLAASCVVGWVISLLTTSRGWHFSIQSTRNETKDLIDLVSGNNDFNATQMADWIRNAGQIVMLMQLEKDHQPESGLPGTAPNPEKELPEVSSPLETLEQMISDAVKVNESERMLLLNLAHGLYAEQSKSSEALLNLQQSASMEPPVRFASEFYADVLLSMDLDNEQKAFQYYLQEADSFEDARHARQEAVRIAVSNEDLETLQKLIGKSNFLESLDLHTRMTVTALLGDWLELGKSVLRFDFARGSPAQYLMTFFAGGIWMIIIGQFAGFQKQQLVLFGAAILLGILSASATLFAVVIHHDVRGFTFEGDLWHQLVYCVAGIGLREETIKLLFFLPLIPLVKKRSDADVLVAASFIGLGFAMQENVGYYLGANFTPWTRFFTANFFHLAATGLLGLAIVNFFRWPRTRWEELIATFLGLVVLHGMYDALLMIPELSQDLSILSLILLALIAYRYFDQAEIAAHPGRSRTISPLGVFILGAATLGAVLMIASCWGIPFLYAFKGFLASGLGIFPVIFIFINRFREA